MSLWDSCPYCTQLGVDEPSIYDAIAVEAARNKRDPIAVAYDFFRKYHEDGHHQETAA